MIQLLTFFELAFAIFGSFKLTQHFEKMFTEYFGKTMILAFFLLTITITGVPIILLGCFQSLIALITPGWSSKGHKIGVCCSACYVFVIILFCYVIMLCNAIYLLFGELPQLNDDYLKKMNPFCKYGSSEMPLRVLLTIISSIITFILFAAGFVCCAVQEFINF